MQKRIISAVVMLAVLATAFLSVPFQVNADTSQGDNTDPNVSLCELSLELEEENPSALVFAKVYTVNVKLSSIVAADELFFVINYNDKILKPVNCKYDAGYNVKTNFEDGMVSVQFSSELGAENLDQTILQVQFLVNSKETASQTGIWLSDITPAYRGADLYDGGVSETLVIGGGEESNDPDDPDDPDDSDEPDEPSETGKFELNLQDVTAEKEAVVPLNVVENPGIHAVGITITFDPNVCSFDRLAVADEFKDKITLQSIYEAPGEGKVGASFLASNVMADTGIFANVYFKIKDGVAVGTTSDVQVEITQASTEESDIEVGKKSSAVITIGKEKADEDTFLMGDVNFDGKVNLLDGMFILRYYNGVYFLTDTQLKSADTYADGKINLLDALQILRYFNGEIKAF